MDVSMKRFYVALILAVVLLVSLVQTPNVYSESTAPEKALTILSEVVGLDTTKYRTTIDSQIQDLYFETLPQEHVKYTLESGESKLEVICVFVNENLRSMSVYITDGSPHTTQPAVNNTLEMAKAFISRYQTYSGASYYGMLRPMLDNVEVNKNVTKTSENAKLEVTIEGSYVSFRWTYTVNGVEALSKCVALYFEQGFLKHFIDTWSLYKIGSTNIHLSKEEAVKTAMDHAKNFSWNVSMGGDNPPVEVTEFNIVGVSKTTLDFGNYITKKDARGGDPLTLYPGWRIYLYFDKLYPGNVYGVNVGIWADTGEVHDIRALISGLGWTPPEDSTDQTVPPTEPPPSQQPGFLGTGIPMEIGYAIVAVTVVAIAAVAAFLVCFGKIKKTNVKAEKQG